MYTNTQHRAPHRRAARSGKFSIEAEALGRTGLGAFMGTVYAWMALGLGLSAFVAYFCAQSPEVMVTLFDGGIASWSLLGAPFILILVLAARMENASPFESAFYYLLLTGIMGTWLTGVAFQATQEAAYASAVYETLVVAIAMFAAMCLTGWIARRDLTGMGNFMLSGLWGLIMVGFLNIYVFQSEAVNLIYHMVGVVLFSGLVAYDTQKIKEYYRSHGAHHGLAIWGALTLYLDFVNLFLHLLRFFKSDSD